MKEGWTLRAEVYLMRQHISTTLGGKEDDISPSRLTESLPADAKASDSGSRICNSSRQSFHVCNSNALISVTAVPSCTNKASSAAILSGDAGSVGKFGVAARFTDRGVLAPYDKRKSRH